MKSKTLQISCAVILAMSLITGCSQGQGQEADNNKLEFETVLESVYPAAQSDINNLQQNNLIIMESKEEWSDFWHVYATHLPEEVSVDWETECLAAHIGTGAMQAYNMFSPVESILKTEEGIEFTYSEGYKPGRDIYMENIMTEDECYVLCGIHVVKLNRKDILK